MPFRGSDAENILVLFSGEICYQQKTFTWRRNNAEIRADNLNFVRTTNERNIFPHMKIIYLVECKQKATPEWWLNDSGGQPNRQIDSFTSCRRTCDKKRINKNIFLFPLNQGRKAVAMLPPHISQSDAHMKPYLCVYVYVLIVNIVISFFGGIIEIFCRNYLKNSVQIESRLCHTAETKVYLFSLVRFNIFRRRYHFTADS
jgi:hypothetical protein